MIFVLLSLEVWKLHHYHGDEREKRSKVGTSVVYISLQQFHVSRDYISDCSW